MSVYSNITDPMSSSLNTAVQGLLNGKQPSGYFLSGEGSEELAAALAAKIDSGVAPSHCAHAMCGSSAAGNVAVVRMLAARPKSTFNKAYNFGEPLRRACRAFVRASDPALKQALAECAKIIAAAGGDLNQPDKYLKSGISAAGSLLKDGSDEALSLLKTLKSIKAVPKLELENFPANPVVKASSSVKRKSGNEVGDVTEKVVKKGRK